ncbi:hypothetical protein ACM1RC_20355 [Paenibacillus azoreducens]|uniref:hypothetical protein n=1 Tax=Paenibacillus azoreducens TaxID=116718 RepID=UPI0039F4887A
MVSSFFLHISHSYFAEHILARHGATSKVIGKNKFNGAFDIRKGIDDTLKGYSWVFLNTNNNPGYIFVKQYTTSIGKDYITGKNANYIHVVLNPNGKVLTAFPSSYSLPEITLNWKTEWVYSDYVLLC